MKAFWFVRIKYALLVFLCMLATACAGNNLSMPTQEEQDMRWQKFLAHDIEVKPYTLQGSFRFGSSSGTNRVNYIFWSNGELPVRVDIMAGVGASIAKITENKEDIVMYFPQEKKAVFMGNFEEMNPLVSLGMPAPLSFYEMSLLLRGGFNKVLQDVSLDTVKSRKAKDDYKKYSYYFSSLKMDGMVQLDDSGLPRYCEINNEWVLELSYEENTQYPHKVVITSLIDDYRAILLVKDRSFPAPYKDEDFKFALPADTEILKN